MTTWTPEVKGRKGPLYVALADAIAEDIERGVLEPGQRLPTQRQLADGLEVALTTVTRGYAEAERRGLVSGEVGRGTFVQRVEPRSRAEESDSSVIDLSMNTLLPYSHARELMESVARLAATGDPWTMLDYQPQGGSERQRAAGAKWLQQFGLEATPQRVLVTSGAQHAMAVTFATLTSPGDTVLTEQLTFSGMKSLARLLRIRLKGVETDDGGLRPDAFEAACAAGGVKALYTMPSLQNPMATLMPVERRREIASIAGAYGVPVVEDDSYGYLVPDLKPLSAFSSNGYYLTGTSKSLASGLRIGFLLPPADMVDRIGGAICSTTFMASPLMAEVVTEWVFDGTAQRVMEWKRRETTARQAAAQRILGAFNYTAHPVSPHGWLELPEPWSAADFVTQARMRGVQISPADDFVAGRAAPHAVRICLGPVHSRGILERGLETIAEILGEAPEPHAAVV